MALFFRSFSLVGYVALGLLLLCGSACSNSDSPDASAASELRVQDFQFTRMEDGTRLFTGKVYNPTSQSIPHAQIKVSLLDNSNRQISSTLIDVQDVAAGDYTPFRQPFDSDAEVEGARVKSVLVL